MSYEVSIKRSIGKSPLTAEDFKRIVTEDGSLSGGDREPIIWTDPISGQTRYINIAPESGELSTDDTQGDDASMCRFLDKLRSIACKLDARVTGEGEDITEPVPASPPKGGCISAIMCAVTVFAVIVFAIIGLRCEQCR